ncbi:adenylyl-sulfate kinase [Natronoglycomyces albus]|uniref:Adenylyl-sulfate kinase n=1 Tax=Natronoglycomyces albus TaxID=2811108 RepID=A0A895XNF7_9ACTN|nr:adenylyl-sulfate kinase [Natronoglycomyces albus]QSB04585.1 adenylyl-sulfate kinase [Natronoglycomyces albus]
MSDWVLPDEILAEAPSHTPLPHELADLELLLCGAYQPLTGFMSAQEARQVSEAARLLDGSSWPTPVTLDIPTSIAEEVDHEERRRRVLRITDAEGAPVAAVECHQLDPLGPDMVRVGGPVRRIAEAETGIFSDLRATPEEAKETYTKPRVLAHIVQGPLHRPQLAQITRAAHTLAAHVLLMIPTGNAVAGSPPLRLPAAALVRSILAAKDRLPAATIITVPLSQRGDKIRDGLLSARVAAAYGATHLLTGSGALSGGTKVRAMLPRELGYDTRDGQWRAIDEIEPPFQRAGLTDAEVADMLDRGFGLPEWHTPPAVAAELRRTRPPRRERGLVVFFTGLSGSGKSTIARGVHETLVESGDRTVSLFDGDVVRQLLSSGLGFSQTDRSTNVRRIGYVAAEVGRHGGIALACPIAPYVADRDVAKALADAAGADFVLVHVATPLEVCEARDRKGLYAKARAGKIKEFTGISDPYEEPTNPELTIDTSKISVDQGVDKVMEYLTDGGWLEPSGLHLG